MSVPQWIALLGICLAGAASPGPSLAVIVSASVGGGKGSGLAAAWAHAAGVAAYALLTVLGVAALLTATPAVFAALQVAGALYLIYMASRLLRSEGTTRLLEQGAGVSATQSAVDGLSVAFLNPKLALFMLALFSQFVEPEFGARDLALMVATVGVVDGLWYTAVALLLTRENWLAKLQDKALLIDRLFAAILATLALSILWKVLAGGA